MPVIPNGIIIACHISRPLGAAPQEGIKRESGPVLTPLWGGGQSRFSCGKGTGYSGRLTEMASSSSWACSMMPGASSNQEAELHLYDILYRQS